MPVGEPLVGPALMRYRHAKASLEQTLAPLPDSAVVDLLANFVVRVALHGADRAALHHGVPPAVARGIAVGLFHAGAAPSQQGKGGRHG